MRFSPDKCPTCGEYAIRTIDSVPALALMERDEDGDYEYTGESKVCWDGQTTETDDEGRWLLDCGEHSWYADATEGDEDTTLQADADGARQSKDCDCPLCQMMEDDQ